MFKRIKYNYHYYGVYDKSIKSVYIYREIFL